MLQRVQYPIFDWFISSTESCSNSATITFSKNAKKTDLLMRSELNPMGVPTEWHRFLYVQILLEWEVGSISRRTFPRFVASKPLAGITLIKATNHGEVSATAQNLGGDRKTKGQLTFLPRNAALKDLFCLIRNCVAHGHYGVARRGWIRFHHVHDGKTKLFGEVKFSSLKSLIELLDPKVV